MFVFLFFLYSFAFAYALIGGENRDEKSFETLEHELGEKDEAVVVCGLLVRYANLKPHILGEEGLNAPGPVVNPTKQGKRFFFYISRVSNRL